MLDKNEQKTKLKNVGLLENLNVNAQENNQNKVNRISLKVHSVATRRFAYFSINCPMLCKKIKRQV